MGFSTSKKNNRRNIFGTTDDGEYAAARTKLWIFMVFVDLEKALIASQKD